MHYLEYLYPHLHQHARTTLTNKLTSYLHSLQTQAQTYVDPIKNLLMSPNAIDNAIAIIACLFIFYVSLKILGYVRQMIMFWVSWGFTILLWGSVFLGAWYVYMVGLEKATRDAAWAWEFVVWFVESFVEGMTTDGGQGRRAGQRGGGAPRDRYGNTRGYGGRGRGWS